MGSRFCVVPDPVFPDGRRDDVAAFFLPEDPELPLVLAASGVESTPVFETEQSFERLHDAGLPEDARKTGERVRAASGFPVEPDEEPFGT